MINFLWGIKTELYRTIRTSFPFNLILNHENRNLELLLQSVDIKGKRVVDLGTGTGNALCYLKDADQILGIDITFSMLKVSRKKYLDVILVQADALKLPIKTNSVYLITAVGLSEYLKEVNPLFKEAFRILKNPGYFLLTFSPPGMLTGVRMLSGHRIYPRTLDAVKMMAQKEQFRFIKNRSSFMQGQMLFQKI